MSEGSEARRKLATSTSSKCSGAGLRLFGDVLGPGTAKSQDSVNAAKAMDRVAIKAHVTSLFANYFVKAVSLGPDEDPLVWWSTVGSSIFHDISHMARKYLTPMASTAPVERTFSAAKFFVREERNRLSDETLDVVVSLNSYLGRPETELNQLVPVLGVTGHS